MGERGSECQKERETDGHDEDGKSNPMAVMRREERGEGGGGRVRGRKQQSQ